MGGGVAATTAIKQYKKKRILMIKIKMSKLMENVEEMQYINLVKLILSTGTKEQTRNGNCLTIFGHQQRFSLKDGLLPVLTTRKISYRIAFYELMFFIRGQTNIRHLHENDVHIWDANSTREFLDSRGLSQYPEGELGPIYGAQWRNYNSPLYNSVLGLQNAHQLSHFSGGVDQLSQVIAQLRDPAQRSSRRIVMTAWNPCQLDKMALPPCHILCQFHVKDGLYLSCALYQRSMDVVLGCPTNIICYALLTHILAKHCDLVADEFVHFVGNAHIYEEHLDGLAVQLERTPFEFPKIVINTKRSNIEDYEFSDIEFVSPYVCHPPIRFHMCA
jgi:thymidylate synthase